MSPLFFLDSPGAHSIASATGQWWKISGAGLRLRDSSLQGDARNSRDGHHDEHQTRGCGDRDQAANLPGRVVTGVGVDVEVPREKITELCGERRAVALVAVSIIPNTIGPATPAGPR